MSEMLDSTPAVEDVQDVDVDFDGWDDDSPVGDEADFDGWDDDSDVDEPEEVEEVNEDEEEADSEDETPDDSEEEAETEKELTEEPDEVRLEDMKFKYLGEEKTLGDLEPEEVVTLVQKGQNHDRIQEQLEPFKEIVDLWNKMGKSDLNLDSMSQALMKDMYKRLAEYNKSTPEIEQRTHELDVREKREKIAKELSEQRAKEESQKQNSTKQRYREFAEKFPEVKVQDLDQSVKDAVNKGQDPITAYQEYQVKSLETSVKKLTKQLNNMKSSPVRPSKGGSAQTGQDPMFDGWDD